MPQAVCHAVSSSALASSLPTGRPYARWFEPGPGKAATILAQAILAQTILAQAQAQAVFRLGVVCCRPPVGTDSWGRRGKPE